jgi:hypothetical protein
MAAAGGGGRRRAAAGGGGEEEEQERKREKRERSFVLCYSFPEISAESSCSFSRMNVFC